MTTDPMAALKERIAARAAEVAWDELLAEAQAMQAEWDIVASGVTDAEAPVGRQSDDPWTPWHQITHVGAWLENTSRALEYASGGESGDLGTDQAFYSDSPDLAEAERRVRSNMGRFLEAVAACAESAPEGVRIRHRLMGRLSVAECVVFTMWHVQDHIRQMRELRGIDA
jgi:hypothetical protein